MKRALAMVLIALLGGAGLLWLVARGSGYILINYAGYQLEMSFWTGLLTLLAALLLVRWGLALVAWLLRAGGLFSWWRDRRQQSASSRREQGLAALAAADWAAARRLLVAARPDGQSDTERLLAARALAGSGELGAALEWLAPLLAKNHRQAQLLAAELSDDHARIVALLEPLAAAKKLPATAFVTLFDALLRGGFWQAGGELLESSQLPAEQLQPLYQRWFSGQLALVESAKQARASWRKLPAPLRDEPDCVASYARRLAELDDSVEAEKLLLKALQKQQQRSPQPLHRGCLMALLALPDAGLSKRLRALEGLLQERPEAGLSYAVARLCQQGQLWGRARDFAVQSLKLQPAAATHRLLAEVYLKLGDSSLAEQQFRRGLELATAPAD